MPDLTNIEENIHRCPTCNSSGFAPSELPYQCEFCDGTFGGTPPAKEEIMLAKLKQAADICASWRQCRIIAIEAERQLLDLGFYNISFRDKVRGIYNGVEFQLEE